MFNKILLSIMLSGLLATGYGLVAGSTPADAAGAAKNLKVLPPDMPVPEIKKFMKTITASLGVQCDFCHDTDDMAKDTEKKEIARKMMTMTADINKAHFDGKPRVGCITCHNGNKVPKGPEAK